jgi:hypothetical protein
LRRAIVTGLAFLAMTVGVPAVTWGFSSPSPAVTGHVSAVEALSVGMAESPSSSGYAVSTYYGGKPVRWDPCVTIHWRLRTSGAPAGALSTLRKAVARIASITGTHWVYDGTTASVPSTTLLPRSVHARPPVVLGWANSSTSDLLRNQPSGILGVTRTAWFGYTANSQAKAAITGAVIAFNSRQHLPLSGARSWYTVALHELGHTAGLAHVSSPSELMYPYLPKLADLQAGTSRVCTGSEVLGAASVSDDSTVTLRHVFDGR